MKNTMTLWSIQPVEVYYSILNTGIYICDSTKSEFLSDEYSFKPAYDWLVKKMAEKVGNAPAGVTYPVWAWLKKPDLRRSAYATRGTQCVCLKLEINCDDIFLTKFDAWHSVLNNFPHIETDDEDEFDEEYYFYLSLPREEKKKYLERSWEKVIVNGLPDPNCALQATFWCLKKEQIKHVRFFTAR